MVQAAGLLFPLLLLAVTGDVRLCDWCSFRTRRSGRPIVASQIIDPCREYSSVFKCSPYVRTGSSPGCHRRNREADERTLESGYSDGGTYDTSSTRLSCSTWQE